MVFLFAQQAHALGLGEIQVNSYLGEPLHAQVDLTDLHGDYEDTLKVRLASVDEYKKSGYPYPYDKRFRFTVLNEDGKHPMVRITSLYPVEDPFLNLMMEVVFPSGRIVRTFTFLIDPAPDSYHSMVSAQPAEAQITSTATPSQSATTPSHVSAAMPSASPARRSKSRTSGISSKYNRSIQVVPRADDLTPGAPVSGKLSLSLSTSLSISSSDPSLPANARETSDALQEELIAKEKTLQNLNEQINEMQNLIKGLQIRLSTNASSSVAESGVSADSGIGATTVMSPASAVDIVATAEVTRVSMMDEWIAKINAQGTAWLGGLMILVLTGAGYYWWRKRKLESGWIPNGLFDDLAGAAPVAEAAKPIVATEPPKPASVVSTVESNKVATKKLAVGEQSIKVPAFKEQKAAPSTLPPEYDLLEEANIYLRFGHDKLAEEVLYDALKINPKNPDIYMTLLGVFDTRADAQGYEKLAKEFKVIANAEAWKKVAEMGKKLDIGNALYD